MTGSSMNCVHISATLTKDPEIKGASCILKVSYCKPSGKRCYITAVATGKIATCMKKLTKGDNVCIDGRLSSFEDDKWKTYLEIKGAYVVPRGSK